MPDDLLPAAFEGERVRLRPVARSDFPQLFAQRIALESLHLYTQGAAIPTFERWETTELQELLKSGPAFVVEDHQGVFLGLVRLFRMELGDGRAYVEFRLAPELDDTAVMESFLAFLDYAFTNFSFRKLYVETIALHDVLIEQLQKFGFEEEVRLKDYLWHGGGYADLLFFVMSRDLWVEKREHLIASLEISHDARQIQESSP